MWTANRVNIDFGLTEWAFFGCGSRWNSISLQRHAVELIQSLHHQKYYKRQNQEIDQRSNKAAIADDSSACLLSSRQCRVSISVQSNEKVVKINLASK